jgi:nucleoside-diphosphate-sugar epimerase|tara:strand:+ start:361 stop:546 length:186 start_codon:yes stop_codon:yes gene_type:complete
MKEILVTGASGFIGSHISDFLTKKGLKVVLFDKKISRYKQQNQKMVLGNYKKRLEQLLLFE